MDRWRQLIESAKASEAESGALIHTLILKLYVINISTRPCDYARLGSWVGVEWGIDLLSQLSPQESHLNSLVA